MQSNPFIQYPPYINQHLANKLRSVIRRHSKLVIGVDFDNTIQDPANKDIYQDIAQLVKLAHSKGHIICIWTANSSPHIVELILKYNNIPYDYFNNSPLMNNLRKPHFNLLLDDIAGLNETYHTLSHILG